MIYLASPYSDPSLKVRTNRYLAACKAAAEMMEAGTVVFSPIAHTHGIALCGGLPMGWDYWERVDREFLAACNFMTVLMLDGWRESLGVAAEIRIAEESGKHITYAAPSAFQCFRGEKTQ